MAQNSGQEMLIAGFAYAGDHANKEDRFHYTSYLEKEFKKSNISISTEIVKRLKNIEGKNFNIVTGRTFSTKNEDSPLNAVLVMTAETVLVENYGDYWKIFVNLRGDALLFDYKGKKIIKTYPLNLAIFDAVEGQQQPSNLKILNLIRENIYTSKKEGLISQFVDKISNAILDKKTDKIFQIGNITIKPEAMDKFPAEIRSNDSAVKDIVADALASELSGQTSISLMPAKFNSVVGVMTMQLEDTGEQIELKIGDGDYIFNVEVNKLAKAKQQQTNSEVSYIYGVNASIQVIEPFSKTVFLESVFRNGAVSISPINKITQDDYPAYYDVINGLFKKFSIALKSRDYKWVNVATGSEKTSEQMKKVSNLLDGKGN
ncbi:hypothetical protein [Limnohabitans planktonicus]|nr:hypothetical protein [Limnohabitans planktonicus]|eukprot:gene22801-27778_t